MVARAGPGMVAHMHYGGARQAWHRAAGVRWHVHVHARQTFCSAEVSTVSK